MAILKDYIYNPRNPYPAYAWLRSQSRPYFYRREQSWLVSRYEQVAFVLRDSRFSKQLPSEDRSPLSNTMLFQDPPNHRRLRDAVVQAFAERPMENIQKSIRIVADRLIDQVEANSQMDFIQQFAGPLPVAIIADMLGVDSGDIKSIQEWTEALVRAGVPGESNADLLHAGAKAVTSMGHFFADLINDSCSLSKENLLSSLIRPISALPHGKLSEDELIGTCMLLMIAGHETTINLLGNGLYLLLTHPEQLALLRSDDSLIANAIEEVLRFESPVQRGTYRCTKEAVEVGEVLIPAGSIVVALIGAANRDPVIFENPDTFNILRNPNPHLGFGQGIHFCLGASIARQEALIALTRLLHRLPNINLLIQKQQSISKRRRLFNILSGRSLSLFSQGTFIPSWSHNPIVRGLTSLPITW